MRKHLIVTTCAYPSINHFYSIQFIGDKLSKKILDQARAQQDDLEEEYGAVSKHKTKKTQKEKTYLGKTSKAESSSDESENYADEQYYEDFVS